MRHLDRLIGLLALLAAGACCPVLADVSEPASIEHGNQFDCVDAFDLVAMATTLGCPTFTPTEGSEAALRAATNRLVEAGFFTAAEFSDITLEWCPLVQAMGFTPNARRILIDDGLIQGSVDLTAEVLAHEMIHVRQFREFGQRGFKCAYVNAYLACGACQDRRHELEDEAYRFQDTVRDHFLDRFIQPAKVSRSNE